MHFPAIAVIHLHHFIIVVDNIRHEHHPFSSKFLRINRFRRIRARPQSRIYQQVRRGSKVLYSVVGLMGFAQIKTGRIDQVKCEGLAIWDCADV